MKASNWTRPYPKEHFSPERLFMSITGLHYTFVNQSSADSFSHSCVTKGNQGLILNGIQVIDTRYRLSK